MPIYPLVLAPGASLHDPHPRYMRTGEIIHPGLVIQQESHDVRVMSDVYAIAYSVVVWDPTTKSPLSIQLFVVGGLNEAEAEVDATPDVLEAYKTWKAEQEAQARHQHYLARCEEARDRLRMPRVGYPARVVKGRKVPIGTEGLVVGDFCGSFGTRIAIVDAGGKTHHTAISNAERVVAQLDGEDWLDTEQRLQRAMPDKWDAVRITNGPKAGTEGTVFYVDGEKLGVAASNRKVDGRYTDVVWVFAANVTVTERRHGQQPPAVNSTTAVPSMLGADVPF